MARRQCTSAAAEPTTEQAPKLILLRVAIRSSSHCHLLMDFRRHPGQPRGRFWRREHGQPQISLLCRCREKLGHPSSPSSRDTAAQETEHAFAHFRLLHPELVVSDPAASDDEQTMLRRCLELAIEGETYEFTTMSSSRLRPAATGIMAPKRNSPSRPANQRRYAGVFHTAAKNFGLLARLKNTMRSAMGLLSRLCRQRPTGESDQPVEGLWICKVCSMI